MYRLVPFAGIAGWLILGDWLAGLALAIVALGWVVLPSEEGPPVLSMAVTMQWVAVSIGFFYYILTKRELDATLRTDYRWMVLLGLGCVLATILGLWFSRYVIGRLKPPTGLRPAHALSFKTLLLIYVIGTATIGVIQELAFNYGGLAQGIIALTYLRLGMVYLIFRRLVGRGEWYYLAGFLVIEVVMGITGFYAGFREPLMMAVLAYLEFFDRRKIRQWAAIASLGLLMVVLGVIWISVRNDYRSRYLADDRFSGNRSARIELLRESVAVWAGQSSADMWNNVDRFVDRMWTVYYPGLAVDRVPSVIPHTGGALMADTLRFVFQPRLLFPDKPDVKSDSEMVRRYSGVMVAGENEGTDIAFGYAAESYIDYGVPLMFLPAFIWAVFIGSAYFLIFREFKHRDLAVAMTTVIGWMSLYLFERSWAKTIGLGGTLLIYAGGLFYILDRLWFQKFKNLYETRLDESDESVEAGPSATAPPPRQLRPQPHSK